MYNLPWKDQSSKSFEAMSHEKILPQSLQVWCEGRKVIYGNHIKVRSLLKVLGKIIDILQTLGILWAY